MSNSLTINVPNPVKQNTPLRNVPSGSTATPDYSVKYVPQTLTEEQKAQARENIGVGGGGTDNDIQKTIMDMMYFIPIDISNYYNKTTRDLKLTVYNSAPFSFAVEDYGMIRKMEHNGVYTAINSTSVSIPAGKTTLYVSNATLRDINMQSDVVIYVEGGEINTLLQGNQTMQWNLHVIYMCFAQGSGWMNPANPTGENLWLYDVNNRGWVGNFYGASGGSGHIVLGDHDFDNFVVDAEGNDQTTFTATYYVLTNRINEFVTKINNSLSGLTSTIQSILNNTYTYTFMDFESDGYTPRLNNVTKYNPS